MTNYNSIDLFNAMSIFFISLLCMLLSKLQTFFVKLKNQQFIKNKCEYGYYRSPKDIDRNQLDKLAYIQHTVYTCICTYLDVCRSATQSMYKGNQVFMVTVVQI